MEELKKVIAVVVTYNRKELLKECIEALLNQDYKNCHILIVDNASTDGTKEYINEYLKNKKINYVNTGANLGGAGGFNYGMKEAYKIGSDFMWVMDDDTIPCKDALKELIESDEILEGKYGFLSSVALWKDDSQCKMNIQKISKDWFVDSRYLKSGLLRTYYATFVSMLIRTDTIVKVGLPIKDFFIWGDDIEYTNRISKKYNCYISGKSQVVHYTTNNEGSNIAKDSKDRINRYKYAYRNEMYIAKQNGIKGISRQIAKICLHLFRVIFISNGEKIKKIRIILSSSLKGLFFNPKVEYIECCNKGSELK